MTLNNSINEISSSESYRLYIFIESMIFRMVNNFEEQKYFSYIRLCYIYVENLYSTDIAAIEDDENRFL